METPNKNYVDNEGYGGTVLILSKDKNAFYGYTNSNCTAEEIAKAWNKSIATTSGLGLALTSYDGEIWFYAEFTVTYYKPIEKYTMPVLRTEKTLSEFKHLLINGTLDGNVEILYNIEKEPEELSPEEKAKIEKIETIKMLTREFDCQFFTDEELLFYLEKNSGDIEKTVYECLLIKSMNTEISVSGLTCQDTSRYFKMLAQKYRPSNTGILLGG